MSTSLRYAATLLAGALLIAVSIGSTARAAADVCSANADASAGIWHTHAAQTCNDTRVLVAVDGSYSQINGLTLPKDQYQHYLYGARVTWVIIPALQVGLGAVNTYALLSLPGQSSARTATSVNLYVKYSHATPIFDNVRLGAMVAVNVPGAAAASESGRAAKLPGLALVPEAATITPTILLYWQPSLLDAAVSIGYAIDRSRSLLSAPPSSEQATSLNIARGNRVILKAGAQKVFGPWTAPWFAVAPFLEVGAALPGGSEVKTTEASLTAGAKLLGGANRFAEIALGVDVGLAGMAAGQVTVPTTVPWQAFLQVTLHLSRIMEAAAGRDERRCNEDADCPSAQTCHANHCATTMMVADPNLTIPTVTLHGIVFDANSKGEVPGATVRIKGTEMTLATTRHSGAFSTWPLDTRQETYELTVSAPGYVTQTTVVHPATWPAAELIRIALVADKEGLPMILRGTLRDSSTGQALVGKIFFPRTGLVVPCDEQGAFKALVHGGTYEVLISAPGYVTQKRTVDGESGESIILNIDLRKRFGLKGARPSR